MKFELVPILIAAAAFLAGFAAAFFYSRNSVSRQVEKLTSAAKRFAAGDLSRKVNLGHRQDFQSLAGAINHMAAQLKTKIEEIEHERSHLSIVLENMGEAVLAVDQEKQVLFINAAGERILGVKRESVTGKSLIQVIQIREIDLMMDEALLGRKTVTAEIEMDYPEEKRLKAGAAGIAVPRGRTAGVLVLTDVTEMRRLENLRREFVANVSHELRTPLTSIKGFVETLLGGAMKDQEQSRRFLAMMEEDAGRLTRLIDSLLELSRLEAREAPLRREELDLAEQARQAAVLLVQQAAQKKITIQSHLETGLRVTADRDRVRQVLMNLLDNAVKFGKTGGTVDIRARRSGGFIRVSVEDNGPGVPAESVQRVFERFYRADKARSRELGGTGLGLAIVKHIVEAHGGTVGCESPAGRGATFYFTLPTA